MSSSRYSCMVVAVVVSICLSTLVVDEADCHPLVHETPTDNHDLYAGINQHMDLSDEDTMEAMLLNYLYAKQMVERLRNSQDINDLQQKRSYWKQCAFNAVSCFGKK